MTKNKVVLENVRHLSLDDLASILRGGVVILLDKEKGEVTLRLDKDARDLDIEERLNILQDEIENW